MKNNQAQQTTPNKIVIREAQVSKSNNTNQLSVEKMKELITDNIIKKASSLVRFTPFICSPSYQKILLSQKSIASTKKSTKKLKQSPKSPKKSPKKSISIQSMRQIKQIEFEKLDIQEKRKRIYGMPYYFENQQINVDDEIKYIAVEAMHSQREVSEREGYQRMYSDSMSTACSNKQKNGMKITDFEIGKVCGMGKFGHVYLARHRKSGFICALKQIKKQGLDQILQTQLIREIKIQMFLNHPNITKLYTFFCDQSHIYLVLEPCCSGQLYNFLKKHQPIKQDLAKVIIRQICQGIDYIHENYIIHRDLKPQNILYHNSMMKICDFGWSIATPLMRDTFCGTPLYVSPELLKRNCYNNKVDIWSIGVLAFEILIGQVPFQIFSEADYIKIIKNQVKFPKFISISAQAKDFIKCCLQKDPQKRPSSRQLLEHPFIKKVQLVSFLQID